MPTEPTRPAERETEALLRSTLADAAHAVQVPSMPPTLTGPSDRPATLQRRSGSTWSVRSGASTMLVAASVAAVVAGIGLGVPAVAPDASPPATDSQTEPAEAVDPFAGLPTGDPPLVPMLQDGHLVGVRRVPVAEGATTLAAAPWAAVVATASGQVWSHLYPEGGATLLGEGAVAGPFLNADGTTTWVAQSGEGAQVVTASLEPGLLRPSVVALSEDAACCVDDTWAGADQFGNVLVDTGKGVYWFIEQHDDGAQELGGALGPAVEVTGLPPGSRLVQVAANEGVFRTPEGAVVGFVGPDGAFRETARVAVDRLWLLPRAVVALADGALVLLDSRPVTVQSPAGEVRAVTQIESDLSRAMAYDLPADVEVLGVVHEQGQSFLVAARAGGTRAWLRCSTGSTRCEVAALLNAGTVTPH